MTKKGLCIVLTDRCTAECEICCFSCGPRQRHTMDRDLMIKAIDQAGQCTDIHSIGFSGGEPFMEYDLLREGACYAKSKGFHVTVATNGFWGMWDEALLMERFTGLPLDSMTISTDYYHSQYVPDAAVERACETCQLFGIEFSLSIGETRTHPANAHFGSMGNYKYLKRFNTYNFHRAGRAETIPAEEFFCVMPRQDACCTDDGLIAVMYDGRVYPCCNQLVFDTQLAIGNIRVSPLDEILSAGETVRLCRMLRSHSGFQRLTDISEHELGVEFAPMATSGCEFCQRMFKTPQLAAKLMSCIDHEYGKIAVDALLGRGEARHGNP